ncbi:MAG: hypothetical protein ACK524_06255, partial [Planctomyces sp.]
MSESDNEDQHMQDTASVTQAESANNNSSEKERTHPLLVPFVDELEKLGCHPTFDDRIHLYMHWHYSVNHASFQTMMHLAKQKH